jgi:hypothetical protein
MTPLDQVRALMRAVLTGDDSAETAAELEGELLTHFLDTALYDEIGDDLALYNPSGGDNYLDAHELRARLAATFNRLDELAKRPSAHPRS